MSNNPSDSDLYEEHSYTEEEVKELSKNFRDPSEWCSCGDCAWVTNAGMKLFFL